MYLWDFWTKYPVQKWKGTKMSRKNGKKLLIAVAVGAVVVKAVKDVIKAKKQEEALKTAFRIDFPTVQCMDGKGFLCGIDRSYFLPYSHINAKTIPEALRSLQ